MKNLEKEVKNHKMARQKALRDQKKERDKAKLKEREVFLLKKEKKQEKKEKQVSLRKKKSRILSWPQNTASVWLLRKII